MAGIPAGNNALLRQGQTLIAKVLRYHNSGCLHDTRGPGQQYNMVILHVDRGTLSLQDSKSRQYNKVIDLPDAKPRLGAFGRIWFSKITTWSISNFLRYWIARPAWFDGCRHWISCTTCLGYRALTSPAASTELIPHRFITDLRPLQVDLPGALLDL